jgi:hypothetical protein
MTHILTPTAPRLPKIGPGRIITPKGAHPFASKLRHGNLDSERFLTFAGLLPVNLPEGTRGVVLPDMHIPAHDKKCLWIVKQAIRDFSPDIGVNIGDALDFYAASAWVADPSVKRDFQMEVDEGREVLDDVMDSSGAYWWYHVMGNHCGRQWRAVQNRCPEFANALNPLTRERALSVHDLLGYGPKDNITFLYDMAERGGYGGGIVVNGDVTFHHGYLVMPKPGASARGDADKNGRSVVHGHTHRIGMTVRNTTIGGERIAVELGHLIDDSHPYIAYSNLLNNHHKGMAFFTIIGGKVHIELVPIVETIVDGQPRHVMVFGDRVYVTPDR